MSNQKHCRSCRHLDFNTMSDEMYCKLKDYEPIRLRWHKNRPDWCPLVKKKERRMTNIQAIDLLKGLEQSLDDYCELNDEGKTAFRMAITALEVFGISEQLTKSKKGKWIYNSPVTMKCNQCGLVIKDWDWNRFDFCPKCCSDMRGEP